MLSMGTRGWPPTLLVAMTCLLGAVTTQADIYKWQDEAGIWHYSDRPPETAEQSFEAIRSAPEPRAMVRSRKVGEPTKPDHAFRNLFHGAAQLEVDLAAGVNVRTEPRLPASFVLPAREERTLVAFRAQDPTQGFSYRITYRIVPGAPTTELPTDSLFYPPFEQGQRFPISQGIDDTHTHLDPPNRYAVDIAMPIGTPVLAARGGIVMDLEDDFHGEGSFTEMNKYRANFIRIEHNDGSMAVYAHLKANSAKVRLGQRVAAGDWIGDSGNSGYSSGPHLHFVVQINVGMALESLPFRFRTPDGGSMDPDRPQYLTGVLAAP